jgi:hypothetical protein
MAELPQFLRVFEHMPKQIKQLRKFFLPLRHRQISNCGHLFGFEPVVILRKI